MSFYAKKVFDFASSLRLSVFLAGLVIASVFSSGCGAAGEFEQTKNDLVSGAKREVENSVPADVREKVEGAARQAPVIAENVKRSSDLTQTILEGHGITLADKDWLQKTAASTEVGVVTALKPLILVAFERISELRPWLLSLVKERAGNSNGEVAKIWVGLLNELAKN